MATDAAFLALMVNPWCFFYVGFDTIRASPIGKPRGFYSGLVRQNQSIIFP
jgi:hypothetical protein